ncbi:MAG: hypothetical protein JWN73_4705 [Betaproteobacteria bacterium]|nr:hypothetical protein [Betaproteobacteria bacterium]
MSGQIGLFGPDEDEPEDDSAAASGKAPEKPQRGVGPVKQEDAIHALGQALPGAIHLGTSTWSFPGWAGIVYDKPASESTLSRRGLTAYSQHPLLRAAGIDRSFYTPMSLAEYSQYARQVPPHFRFLVKAPSFITDESRRSEKGTPIELNPRFLDAQSAFDEFVKPAIAGLGEKAGPLVFQFSPLSFQTLRDVPGFIKRLHAFLYALNQMCEGFSIPPLFAVEVRNGELLTRDFADALKDTGTRYCLGLHARMPTAEEQLPLLRALWPGPLVVRWNLHSGFRYEEAKAQYAPFNKLVDEDPHTRGTLARVIAATAAAGYPVYLVANNKAEGSAPLTVVKLAAAIIEEIRKKAAAG